MILLFDGLMLFELGLRVFSRYRYHDKYFLWPPFLSQIVTPEVGVFPGISGEQQILINAHGLRGSPWPEDATYYILAVGGSSTEGDLLDEKETWPQRLEERLSGIIGKPIWVGNAGRRGSTTRDHLLHFTYFVPQLARVDAILLLVGVNDLMLALQPNYQPKTIIPGVNDGEYMSHAFFIYPYINQGIKSTATWQLLKRLKISVFGRNYIIDRQGKAHIYWRSRRQNAQERRTTLPDISTALLEYKENVYRLIDMATGRGQRIILLTQPFLWKKEMSPAELELLWFGCVEEGTYVCYTPEVLAQGLQQFNQVLLTACQEKGVECIDLTEGLPQDTTVFYDDVHFNETGTVQVAEIIADYLLKHPPLSEYGL